MQFRIDSDHIAKRLDKFLTENLSALSRSQIQKLIKHGAVLVNNKQVAAHYFLKAKDIITINDKSSASWQIATNKKVSKQTSSILKKIKIVAETDDYLVINKPAGLLVHPVENKQEMTLVDWLIKKYPTITETYDHKDKFGIQRPGIAHRLDCDASGLLVVAKTQVMFDFLKKQFQTRQIQKEYQALVHGVVVTDEGEIKTPLARSKAGRIVARTDELAGENSKAALTHYEVLQRFKKFTLLKVKIITGRTHQIRVHLRSIGHAVVGDELYQTRNLKHLKNKPALKQLFLCAVKLGFYNLDNNWQDFKIRLPLVLTKFFKMLK